MFDDRRVTMDRGAPAGATAESAALPGAFREAAGNTSEATWRRRGDGGGLWMGHGGFQHV